MKLVRASIWSAYLGLSWIGMSAISAAPKNQGKPGPAIEFLHLETSKGTIDCALSGHPTVIKYLKKQVNTGTYNGSVVCRAVTDYFVQFGCDLASEARVDGDVKIRLSATGVHDQPGTLSFAQYPGGDVGAQFIITAVKSSWLDGVQPVVGQCRPLDLIKALSTQPTLAGGVPRRPTMVIRASIDRLDSGPGTNGLAK